MVYPERGTTNHFIAAGTATLSQPVSGVVLKICKKVAVFFLFFIFLHEHLGKSILNVTGIQQTVQSQR